MSKHIVLPTNTSDLDTIKKVLDYLYKAGIGSKKAMGFGLFEIIK